MADRILEHVNLLIDKGEFGPREMGKEQALLFQGGRQDVDFSLPDAPWNG